MDPDLMNWFAFLNGMPMANQPPGLSGGGPGNMLPFAAEPMIPQPEGAAPAMVPGGLTPGSTETVPGVPPGPQPAPVTQPPAVTSSSPEGQPGLVGTPPNRTPRPYTPPDDSTFSPQAPLSLSPPGLGGGNGGGLGNQKAHSERVQNFLKVLAALRPPTTQFQAAPNAAAPPAARAPTNIVDIQRFMSGGANPQAAGLSRLLTLGGALGTGRF